jgi:hypoxia up-regulated 1
VRISWIDRNPVTSALIIGLSFVILLSLRELKAAETRKKNREEARNVLEAYTYKLRDRLEQETFQLHSTEQEINDLKSTRNEVSDWLNDWAEQAPLKELKEKKQKLE